MTNFFSRKSPFQKFTVAAFLGATVITQSGCDLLIAQMLQEDVREAKIDEELQAVQKVCQEGHQAAQGYLSLKAEGRAIGNLGTVLEGLQKCRREIEFVVSKKFDAGSGEEEKLLIQDPSKEGFSLNGTGTPLSQAYRATYELEKKVLSQPVPYCLQRSGRLEAKGVNGNWEPLKFYISDWAPKGCTSEENLAKWGFDASTPPENKARIEELCKGGKINTDAFEVEQVSLSIVKKHAFVTCEKPQQTTPASKVMSTGAVPLNPAVCPDCKSWVGSKE
jgi:hypothetical protein